VSAHGSSARFYGCLDIKTLGGAGFASQKATGEWDLGEYVAIRVEVEKGDKFVRSCLLLAMWLLMVGVGSATPVRGNPFHDTDTVNMICLLAEPMWLPRHKSANINPD